jgi:hypothetical protein
VIPQVLALFDLTSQTSFGTQVIALSSNAFLQKHVHEVHLQQDSNMHAQNEQHMSRHTQLLHVVGLCSSARTTGATRFVSIEFGCISPTKAFMTIRVPFFMVFMVD